MCYWSESHNEQNGGPYIFYSSVATNAHEASHLRDFENNIGTEIDNIYKNKMDRLKIEGECASDALSCGTRTLLWTLNDSYLNSSSTVTEHGSGDNAENSLIAEYIILLGRIESWARNAYPDWFIGDALQLINCE